MGRFLLFLGAGALTVSIVGAGCGGRVVDVSVRQPIAFPHGAHLTYYASGEHRKDGIAVHKEVVDMADLPADLVEGRCAECHSEESDLRECAGCHVPSQSEALRRQKDVRKCVGCHRGAWAGSSASIPSASSCRACHDPGVSLARNGGKTGKGVEGLGQEVPWMRINTLPEYVYFSHTAHVRYAAMPCTRCHQDVNGLRSPPTKVHAFTMSECLRCHAQNGAKTDCLTCHK